MVRAMTYRLAILGGGNMGAALVQGLLDDRWAPPADVLVIEPRDDRREELADAFDGLSVAARLWAPVDGAVVAVKPGDVLDAVESARRAGAKRLLSIAAGVSTATIEEAVGDGIAVVRAMPNTPALVREGASALAAGSSAGEEDLQWAEEILAAVGTVVRVTESDLDAVTGLTGSGPAYVFLVAEALIEAGVLNGLSRQVSEHLVIQLLVGSSRMLAEAGQNAATLRAQVTSPGGTTAAGLRVLEQAGLRAAFLDAVTAAADRSRVLARGA
jgi:pyrroline-5-carboxylate reductase